jgi:hypothetical protein
MRTSAFVLLFVLLVSVNSICEATCYTVHSPKGKVVYQSTTSPVDLSTSISEGMKNAFPDHSLVMSSNQDCHEVQGGNGIQKSADFGGVKNSKNQVSFETGGRDLSNYFEHKEEMYVSSSPAFRGSAKSAGTDVNVRGYTRADGTHVRGHTRAAAGGGKRGR